MTNKAQVALRTTHNQTIDCSSLVHETHINGTVPLSLTTHTLSHVSKPLNYTLIPAITHFPYDKSCTPNHLDDDSLAEALHL